LRDGAPASSFVYRVFENQTAALIWRLWDDAAIPVGDSGTRRPLVSRILVGECELLDVEVAAALSRGAAKSMIQPRPGRVMPNSQALPPMEGDYLRSVAGQAARQLDADAGKEPGLDLLIAAALRDPGTPLAVQLPPEELGEPSSGPQLPILWGLWRTTRRFLCDEEGRVTDWAPWSFSTFEPPLNRSGTSQLPRIVFRASGEAEPAQVVRTEIEISLRSREQSASRPTDLCDEVAAALQRAYAAQGGDVLDIKMREVSKYSKLDDRLEAALRILGDTEKPGKAAVVPPAITTPTARSAPTVTTAPPPRLGPPPRVASALSAPLERIASTPEPPHREGRTAPARTAATTDPPAIGTLLTRLSVGPASPEFAPSLSALMELPAVPDNERPQARSQLFRRDFLMDVLIQHSRWHIEQVLETIFTLTVIPDLTQHQVRVEVATWAADQRTPPAVIRALSAAADSQGGESPVHLDSALTLALYRRWLAEHSIYPRPQSHAADRTSASAKPRRRPVRWPIFLPSAQSGNLASVLALVSVTLVVVLVLAVVFRW
jgi:hypothetical protein